jgi:hypothetical protein
VGFCEHGNETSRSVLIGGSENVSSILAGRLSKWFIYHKMLTKFQAGFVKGNTTAGIIFVSKAIVHRYLRNKTGYAHWCFVDMENGLYSVTREALWYKIRKKGISGNMVE